MTLEELICAAVEEIAKKCGAYTNRGRMDSLGGESARIWFHFRRGERGSKDYDYLGKMEIELWIPSFRPQRIKNVPFGVEDISNPAFFDDLEGYIKNLIGSI